MARLISYILLLLFTVTAFTQRGKAAVVLHGHHFTQHSYKKEIFHAGPLTQDIEKYKEKAKFKKKKHIKTRYMKAEIRFLLSSIVELPRISYFTLIRQEFFYIACYSSHHHKLQKLRGPPQFIS